VDSHSQNDMHESCGPSNELTLMRDFLMLAHRDSYARLVEATVEINGERKTYDRKLARVYESNEAVRRARRVDRLDSAVDTHNYWAEDME
jgi:hypothetical protein